jgi:hypothetical protein
MPSQHVFSSQQHLALEQARRLGFLTVPVNAPRMADADACDWSDWDSVIDAWKAERMQTSGACVYLVVCHKDGNARVIYDGDSVKHYAGPELQKAMSRLLSIVADFGTSASDPFSYWGSKVLPIKDATELLQTALELDKQARDQGEAAIFEMMKS